MKVKNIMNKTFGYTPKTEYQFTLEPDADFKDSTSTQNSKKVPEVQPKISENIDKNLEYIKVKYNILINNDIIIRKFYLNCGNKKYKAFILYIDGMCDTKNINDFILKPLMIKNLSSISKINTKNLNKNLNTKKKFNLKNLFNKQHYSKQENIDLSTYIETCLLPQISAKKITSFEEIFNGVNSGDCALFIDTINTCFDLDVKGFKQRAISKPENEIVIKGSHEAFVENLRTNTSFLRRLSNTENLIIENVNVGKVTKTKCTVCYIKNIANDDLVAEAKYRLNNLNVDSLLSAGELEQLLSDTNFLGIPKILVSERPDNAVKALLQGRVIILVNGSPYALILPAVLIDFLTSPEDTNLKTVFANFLKVIRIISAFFALFLPGLYIAITSFHREIIPTELLFSILSSRQSVPFPIIVEIIMMEISFEIIREAGLRVPSPIGPTLGIIGALVLGQATVSAGIVSPILIIIVAITGISSFAIPDFSFSFHLRFYRFVFVILGFLAGFLGIGVGIFIYLTALCDLESFGVPYMSPYAPAINSKNNNFLLSPIWKREFRAPYWSPKREKRQNKISMKWRY